MGFWNSVLRRKKELIIIDDKDLYSDDNNQAALKKIAIETVIGMIARTVIQSEMRVKKNGKYIKDEMYYRLNVRPNKNQSASVFWNEVIFKLVYDGECLIVKSRSNDLLIADDYVKNEKALFEDTFTNVFVKGIELTGTFTQSEVYFFEYGNERLSNLIDSLFYDYGELIKRLMEQQMRKNQLRASINIDSTFAKDEKSQERIENFISKTYAAIRDRSVALFPQQKGLEYEEHSKNASTGASVDEINKMTDGFMDLVANTVGMPTAILRGDIADVDKITRNYMKFCIDPFIKIIQDQLNMKSIKQSDFVKGDAIEVKRISYRDMLDNAVAVDKLRSSSIANGHELRDEIGLEHSDDPIHSKFILTKNYTDADASFEGGENE